MRRQFPFKTNPSNPDGEFTPQGNPAPDLMARCAVADYGVCRGVDGPGYLPELQHHCRHRPDRPAYRPRLPGCFYRPFDGAHRQSRGQRMAFGLSLGLSSFVDSIGQSCAVPDMPKTRAPGTGNHRLAGLCRGERNVVFWSAFIFGSVFDVIPVECHPAPFKDINFPESLPLPPG